MRNTFKTYLDSIYRTDLTVYDAISPSNIQEAQAEFLANPDLSKPNFKYEGLEKNILPETLRANLSELEKITKNLDNDAGLSSAEKELLLLCADDCWTKNALVLAASDYRDAPSNENALKFRQFELKHYGKDGKVPLDRTTFLAMLKWHMDKISPHDLKIKEDRKMCINLMNTLRQFEWQSVSPKRNLYRPSEATMQHFAAIIEDHFEHFFRHIPKKDEFSAQEVCNILNEIIQTELNGKTKFKAIVDENRTALSIEQLKREICIPLHRAKGPYDYATVKCTVVGHEFCTHAYRGIPFELSGITPFYQGIPGYDNFDEGLANCVEYALKGEFKDAGFPSYVCIALAEFGNMNFRQIYETILALDFLSNNVPGESAEDHQKRLEKAQKLAFSRAYRTLRGTNELTFIKDLIYYNSNVMTWQYITENINQKDLTVDLFESGKTDISKTEHRRLINLYRQDEFA